MSDDKLDMCVSIVAQAYDVTRAELRGPARHRRITGLRQVVYWLARTCTGQGYSAIGRYMGCCDHTSALHGYERVEREREQDIAVKAKTDALAAVLISLERRGALLLAQEIDAAAVARRIMASPSREAANASISEIVALAAALERMNQPKGLQNDDRT